VRALLDVLECELGQARAEDRGAVPLGLRRPLVLRVLPRALGGDREYGELRAVALRLTLLGVRSYETDDRY
jgi:hypothetical protein